MRAKRTEPPLMSEVLENLLDGYQVRPDPSPDACEAANLRMGLFTTMRDRGCPTKLAREVSRLKDGHRCESTHALESAMGWRALALGEAHHEVLVLAGQRGRGKSYAAAQVLAQMRPGSGCPRWANARHIGTWLFQRGHDVAVQRHLERISTAKLLVIDDLGWEHMDRGGYAQGAFVGIIDDRIQAELRTILTTNMGEAKFRERYGDALHDRVRGYGLWVDVEPGCSLR